MRVPFAAALVLCGVLVRPAPAQEAPTVPMPDAALPAGALPPAAHMTDPEAIQAATNSLQEAMRRAVPHQVPLSHAAKQRMVDMAAEMLQTHQVTLDHAQLMLVVDRNPRVQTLAVVMAQPDGPWRILGATHVSTGQAGRKYYYITPTGVFPHDGAILDYRAEGTFNENHIRGLGLKGMRVWDFGWQWARKGWYGNGDRGQIRLEMHATDPQYLAQRLGHPASEGCVRIPAALNKFLDHHGVLDADYERLALTDPRYAGVLPKDRDPTPLAGDLLVVVDSSTASGL